MSDAVVILGMFRSGNETVAEVLTKLGATAPEVVPSAAVERAFGSFTSTRFSEFHDELLASAGSHWRDWRTFNPVWSKSPVAKIFNRRARQLVEAEYGGAPLAVLQDPRVCRFPSFWLEVLDELKVTPRILIPVRSPLAVARALKQSTGLPLPHGLLLWLRHVLDAEFQTRNEFRAVFSMARFTADWRTTCDKIATDIGLAWPRLSDRTGFEIERVIGRDQIDDDAANAELIAHSDMHEWASRAYAALLELAANPLSNSARDTLDQIRDRFGQSCAIFGRALVAYEARIEDAENEKDAALSAAEAQVHATQLELGATRDALDEMRIAFQRAERLATGLADEVIASKHKKLATQSMIEEELGTARQELAAFRAALSMLETKLRDKEEKAENLRAQLTVADDEKRIAIEAANEEAQAIRDQLAARNADLAALQGTLDGVKSAFAGAEERAAWLSAELEKALTGKREAETTSEKEIHTLKQELARAQSTLDEMQSAAHAFTEAENKRREQERAAFTRAEERAASLSAELEAAMAGKHEVETTAAEEIGALKQELARTQSALDEMQSAAHALAEAEDKRLEQEKAAFTRAEERAAWLSAELQAAMAGKHEVETTAAEEIGALKQELAGARFALGEMQSAALALEEAEAKLHEHEKELLFLRRQIVILGDENRIAVHAAREEALTARQQLSVAEHNLADLREALDGAIDARRAIERAAEDERANNQQELANTRTALDELRLAKEAEVRAIRHELTEALQALEAGKIVVTALAETQAKLCGSEQDLTLLREQISVSNDRIVAQTADNAELRRNVVALAQEFEQSKAIARALEDQVDKRDAELSIARHLLEAQSRAFETHNQALARLDTHMKAAALKQALDKELVAAAQSVRPLVGAMPYGLAFHAAQLRSPYLGRTEAKRKLRAERRLLQGWGLFDAPWYLAQNPDVAASGMDPFEHFLRHGIAEDRDPHPLFCSGWYRLSAREALGRELPLLHYLRVGQGSRLSPHPLFDANYYLDQNKDVGAQGADPFTHFRTYGAAERRNPHPLIWMDRLAAQKGFESSANPLLDYVTDPRLFGASPHPLFDGAFYLSENKEVAKAGLNPLLHYCTIGWRAGRAPHPLFAGDWYLADNPDVASSNTNPLCHYLRHGWLEKRSPHPFFDALYYLGNSRDARRSAYDPLSHYVMTGAREGRETTDKISVAFIRQVVPAERIEREGPLAAFLQFDEIALSLPPALPAMPGAAPPSEVWPPVPEPVYWLPQKLRDHLIERFGEATVGLYLYLMSVIERFGDKPEAFAQSAERDRLVDRLRMLARERRNPRRTDVDVSIIIPVYNNFVFTLTSVVSLLENETRYVYEILIGDDLSSDATQDIFSAVGTPLRLIRHAENLGFLGNCNRCGEEAKGRFIVLLNNDTLILPGWLDELIEPLENSTDIGLCGSKLLNADGTLQEAGGIFWQDGSAWNFGRGDNPRLPQFNYRKDVDYVSGAAIALPIELWRRLGGFDPEFAPAYCEDSDLAFRVRKSGLRTIYAPHSELVHHEGKSHGCDTGSGIKAYQVANQAKLLARWQHVLKAEHFANGETVFLARDRSRLKPHILFVDHYIPQWDRDAGSRTMFHFLRMFVASGFQVSFWPDNLHEDRDYCAELQKLGIEIIYSAAYLDQFDRWMMENGAFFDYALVSRPHIALKYYRAIRAHARCKILYYGHDIHHRRMELERATNDSPELIRAIEQMRIQEFDNWALADVILYPSVEERDVVRELLPRRQAEQVPMLGYLPEELATARENIARFDARERDDILFVGGAHPPNVDALLWFAREVMPAILDANPKARLNVVGATMNPEIERLDSESILIRGRLSDAALAELYARAGVAVIPLRFGGGVKGKTIEALLHAIPIVSTSIGMQGLAPPQPIGYITDNVVDFAAAVIKAQTEYAGTKLQVERGLAFIAEAYSLEALRQAFAGFVGELVDE